MYGTYLLITNKLSEAKMLRFSTIILLLTMTPLLITEQRIFLVGDEANVPVSYTNEMGDIVGIDVEIIQEVGRRLNWIIKIELRPWARVLDMAKSGRADGGFPLVITSERKNYALFTQTAVHSAVMAAYTKPGRDFPFNSIQDFHNKTVGINRNFSISSEFDSAAQQQVFSLIEVDEVSQLVNMVLSERIDLLIAKRSNIGFYLNKSGKKLHKLGNIDREEKAFLVI